MSSLREALEAALLENPDDLAAHMAYADWLSEQPDPALRARGEFVQVQLALEDPNHGTAERKRLKEQERALFRAHEAEWLGELAPFFSQVQIAPGPGYGTLQAVYEFRRGWLDAMESSECTVAFSRALARSPATRLLRRLAIHTIADEHVRVFETGENLPRGEYQLALYALRNASYLGNVRFLQLGEYNHPREEDDSCRTNAGPVLDLIQRMPKLEELYLLAHGVDTDELFGLNTLHHLRVLLVYHLRHYPLEKLAENPALGNLTHLLCHPHALGHGDDAYIDLPGLRAVVRSPHLRRLTHLRLRLADFGDAGCQEIVDSGTLKRLQVLDLRHGCITDAGARILAGCPDLKNLELLDLTHNALTPAGIEVLESAVVQMHASDQWTPTGNEYRDQEYLYYGDME